MPEQRDIYVLFEGLACVDTLYVAWGWNRSAVGTQTKRRRLSWMCRNGTSESFTEAHTPKMESAQVGLTITQESCRERIDRFLNEALESSQFLKTADWRAKSASASASASA